MQIREYAGLNEKEERRPSFYTRWFCCMNKACKTTLVMPCTLRGGHKQYFPNGRSSVKSPDYVERRTDLPLRGMYIPPGGP
jgi:hypothetical protein